MPKMINGPMPTPANSITLYLNGEGDFFRVDSPCQTTDDSEGLRFENWQIESMKRDFTCIQVYINSSDDEFMTEYKNNGVYAIREFLSLKLGFSLIHSDMTYRVLDKREMGLDTKVWLVLI